MQTTVGQVIVNDMLPEDMRDYNRVWDKKTKGKVLTELAKRHPDKFKEVSFNLMQFGARASYETGGQSYGLSDEKPLKIAKEFQTYMDKKMQDILERAYAQGLTSSDPKVQKAISDAAEPWMEKIDQGLKDEMGEDNPLYRQAFGTGAQKPGTLRSIVGADVFYEDQNGKRVPIPVTHGYAEGLTPAEYFIQSFGTRKGAVNLQKATQDAGFLCLAEGTLVRMADFSTKPIEAIQEGDWVLGMSEDRCGIPVKVTHLFNNGVKECFRTRFAGSIILESTKEHKVYGELQDKTGKFPIGTEGTFMALLLKDIYAPSDKLLRLSQDSIGKRNTYDIEVDADNHLFVLANGLIVSNSKQLVQIAHRLVVTEDDDTDSPYDNDNPTGYPVSTDDSDNEGSFLARDTGGYKRNTLLTPKILADLKAKGHDNILIRSVMVGGPGNGGVYAYDCGVREKGRVPTQGDFVGINAVQSISEPLTQGAISCLDPDTPVRMANADVKLLKELKVGDKILGADILAHTAPTTVKHIYHNGVQPVYETLYRQDRDPWEKIILTSTLEHKVLQARNCDAKKPTLVQLPVEYDGCAVVTRFGHLPEKYVKVCSKFLGNRETLDIEVDNKDHLFVLANGLVVSNSKHSGGVAGASSGKAISGFKYINQLIQVPKHFQGGAVHSDVDGTVDRIEDAPQGGKYIYVAGQRHYVGRTEDGEIPITVKVGDRLEAGDVMTEGTPNPAIIVKYKGLGEGRRYFTNTFRNALETAGTPVHRRNIEALARGLISYVKLTDEMGDYSPDDIVPYAAIAKQWQPRKDAIMGAPNSMVGKYLEKPILHYTIGTKIRPSMIKDFNSFGIKQVVAHNDPPPFESDMVRGMAHVSKDPDWGTRMLGAYNKDSLLEGARLGASSNPQGTSYVPAIAFGGTDFGRTGALKQASNS